MLPDETQTENLETTEETTQTATDDLDSILKEFEETRAPKPAAANPAVDTASNRYREFLERKIAEDEEAETVNTVQSYASLVKEASGQDVSVEAIEGALLRKNLVDKEFRRIVGMHRENPEAVRRYMKAIAPQIVKPFLPEIDPQVSDSKEAVRAAAKTDKPAPVEDKKVTDEDVWAMSRAEFKQYERDVLAGKR